MRQAATAFRGDGNALMPGINVRLYQQLAQRWLGPVGWLVAVWTRILVFGTGIASLLRFGNPVRQIVGGGFRGEALCGFQKGSGCGGSRIRCRHGPPALRQCHRP